MRTSLAPSRARGHLSRCCDGFYKGSCDRVGQIPQREFWFVATDGHPPLIAADGQALKFLADTICRDLKVQGALQGR